MNVLKLALPLVAALSLSACGVNSIPTKEEGVKSAWGEVENQYQRRADLIPNLVATVQGYAKQEQDVLVGVTEARAKATSLQLNAQDLSDPAKVAAFSQHSGEAPDEGVARAGGIGDLDAQRWLLDDLVWSQGD